MSSAASSKSSKKHPVIVYETDSESEIEESEIEKSEIEDEKVEETVSRVVEDDGCVWFHEKHKFTLHGFTMYDVLITQEYFQPVDRFKRSVNRIDLQDLELYKHPLIFSMTKKIEDEYGMRIKGVFINHYQGDDYAPYHRDSYDGVEGVFTVSIGGSRMFYTKNDNTGTVTKHLLEDGDLYFFNSKFNAKNKHSVPKLKKFTDPRISVVFFA